MYLFLLACKPCLCVHIHIPVHVGPCVETYLFALWKQVQCSPRGPFCFMSWGSKNSLANSIQLQLQHQPQPSPVSVPEAGYWTEGARSVYVWETEWMMTDGWQTHITQQTERLTDRWMDNFRTKRQVIWSVLLGKAPLTPLKQPDQILRGTLTALQFFCSSSFTPPPYRDKQPLSSSFFLHGCLHSKGGRFRPKAERWLA